MAKDAIGTRGITFGFRVTTGLPQCLNGKESTFQCRRHGFDPWVRKIPWRRKWQPIHSSTFAWEIPWTEESGGLQSLESQKSETQLSN